MALAQHATAAQHAGAGRARPCDHRAALRLRAARRRTHRAGPERERRRRCRGRGWIDLADATAHVLGKGSKRRSVPVGRAALQALQAWLALRATLAQADEPALFVSRRGTRLTANQLRNRLQAQAPAGRAADARAPAHAAPQLRQRTCCSPAATCARCRNCWATPASARRRSTPSSTTSTWPRSTTRRTRAPSASREPAAGRVTLRPPAWPATRRPLGRAAVTLRRGCARRRPRWP